MNPSSFSLRVRVFLPQPNFSAASFFLPAVSVKATSINVRSNSRVSLGITSPSCDLIRLAARSRKSPVHVKVFLGTPPAGELISGGKSCF